MRLWINASKLVKGQCHTRLGAHRRHYEGAFDSHRLSGDTDVQPAQLQLHVADARPLSLGYAFL